MGYVIVWNPNNREPFIHLNDHYFKEEFSSYENAKEEAEHCIDNDQFCNYTIYKEVTS